MTAEQRFCPLCSRVFTPGEAVLRCDGCGVLHHPGCWVTNNGCSTQREHQSSPVAQAYGAAPRPSDRSPATGRLSSQPSPIRPQREALIVDDAADDFGPDDDADDDSDLPEPTIGAEPQPDRRPRVRRGPPAPASMRPNAPRRYDDSQRPPVPGTLPKVYGRRRVIDLWYIPAAIIVAAVVAIGVILGVEQLTGNDDNNAPAAASSRTATASAAGSTTPAASATSTAPAAGTAGAATGQFDVGQTLVVTGTGDCLNVRAGPSTANDSIVCAADGTTVTVTGGPQDAQGYTWWKVQTDQGEGWAVGDYLAPS